MDWKSAITFTSEEISPIVREILEELKYEFKRETTEKYYSQLLILFSVPKFAYVFRFVVEEPSSFIIDTYDTKYTHAGNISYIEILNFDEISKKDVERFLKKLVEKLPRKPWKFTLNQRFLCGFLTPEFLTARKQWKKMGI